MASTIGSELTAIVDRMVQRTLLGATKVTSGSASNTAFAKELLKRHDASGDGLLDERELQAALTAPTSQGLAGTMLANSGGPSADELWERARMQSIASGNGMGDAFLEHLGGSYSRDRDDDRGGYGGGSMFDLLTSLR